jgi:hypothetical protein
VSSPAAQAEPQAPAANQSLQPQSLDKGQVAPRYNHFTPQRLEEKKAAAVAALRAMRGVPEPTSVPHPVEQAPVPEQRPTPAAPQAPQPPDYAQLLAAQEQRIRAAVEAEQRAAAREAAAQAKEAKLQESVADPLSFLSEVGFTPDEWQAFLMNGGKKDPVMERVKAAEERAAKAEQMVLEAQKQQAAQRREAERNYLANAITQNLGSDFPLLAQLGGGAAVLAKIEHLNATTGQDHGAQFRQVAEAMEADYMRQLEPALKSDAFQAKYKNSVFKPNATLAAPEPQTLNSSVTNSTGPTRPGPRSWEEKKQLAVAALQRLKNAQ